MNAEHDTLSLKVYSKVLAVLLFLTAMTVLIAQVDFGVVNVFIAMGIATIKASLVLLFFMHLKYDDKFFLVIFLTGVFFLVIIFLICELDILTRIPESPLV